jgi:hypothetical protein
MLHRVAEIESTLEQPMHLFLTMTVYQVLFRHFDWWWEILESRLFHVSRSMRDRSITMASPLYRHDLQKYLLAVKYSMEAQCTRIGCFPIPLFESRAIWSAQLLLHP